MEESCLGICSDGQAACLSQKASAWLTTAFRFSACVYYVRQLNVETQDADDTSKAPSTNAPRYIYVSEQLEFIVLEREAFHRCFWCSSRLLMWNPLSRDGDGPSIFSNRHARGSRYSYCNNGRPGSSVGNLETF